MGRVSGIVAASSSKRRLAVDQLNPVVIGIVSKGNASHVAIRRLLLEAHAVLLHLCASFIQIVDEETNVSESLWFFVAIMHLEVWILLCAVVPSEFKTAVPQNFGQTVWLIRVDPPISCDDLLLFSWKLLNCSLKFLI